MQPWLRVSFLRATGETNHSTTAMVSSAVQRNMTMLRLIAQQRQILALESRGAGQENEPGQHGRMKEIQAALAYEGFSET